MFRIIKRSPWIVIGVAGAWLFDPVSGPQRRAMLASKARDWKDEHYDAILDSTALALSNVSDIYCVRNGRLARIPEEELAVGMFEGGAKRFCTRSLHISPRLVSARRQRERRRDSPEPTWGQGRCPTAAPAISCSSAPISPPR